MAKVSCQKSDWKRKKEHGTFPRLLTNQNCWHAPKQKITPYTGEEWRHCAMKREARFPKGDPERKMLAKTVFVGDNCMDEWYQEA